ncbi:MAG: calcium-binding protein [Waterburya sp.]
MATGTITIQGDNNQNLRITNQSGVNVTGTEGPDILNGSDGNDTINALGGDDTIFGSLGLDRVDGGAGSDTVDYSSVNGTITLFPQGLLNNGNPQTSQLVNMETIIAASGKANTIDASAVTSSLGATLDVNLGTNKLTVNNIPNLGTQNFTVQNFVNVKGTQNNDSIIGNNAANNLSGNGGNDVLTGAGGNDVLTGGGGNDTLSGTDSSAKGVGELDNLTGGEGIDKFLLGDSSGAFYEGRGDGDFAKISDFGAGEQIQLGSGDTYQIERGSGTFKVFVTTDGAKDLIADVSFGSSSANARTANSSDVLAEVPEGDFSITSGESLGIFVGA